MTYNESLTNDRIRIRIIYNSIIFLIFLFWFSYYTFEDVSILILLSLVTFLVILAKFMIDRKYGFTEKELVVYIYSMENRVHTGRHQADGEET